MLTYLTLQWNKFFKASKWNSTFNTKKITKIYLDTDFYSCFVASSDSKLVIHYELRFYILSLIRC